MTKKEANDAPNPQSPSPEAPPMPDEPDAPAPGIPVVGIGASAGGLAAFESFLSAIPADTDSGLAFILVQHLAPDHKSILTDLVKRYTRMQVFEVEDGMKVQPNCTYIIPPNRDMAVLNGALQLLEPTILRGQRLPIDFFFRSLAQDQGERAICVILSGTGSDGTLGARAVKGAGGMVMAQSPDSTEYDGMPRSAIATGMVDYVLPPAQMPAQILEYVAHAFSNKSHLSPAPTVTEMSALKKICVLVRAQTGHDFSQYKEPTLLRRVERRMAIQQIEQLDDYLRYLQHSSTEVETLFHDLLIGVTSFFRDPDAFAALQTEVIPRLFTHNNGSRVVRVWVCGCSTGEEAYSLAILIREHLDSLGQPFKVQIFATDVDRRAIDRARAGIFPASISADISPERVSRFFTQETDGGDYRIRKDIRDLLVFSEQDVIKDPPFSKIDLISCRNLLIYLNAELQQKLIPLFHYALNPGGILFLGTSETVGDQRALFSFLDRKWKILLRSDTLPEAVHPPLGDLLPPPATAAVTPPLLRTAAQSGEGATNLRGLIERALLAHYAQVALLVNGRGEVLHIYGRTGQYLEPAPGDATGMNVLAMARTGLEQELALTLRKAVARKEPVQAPGVRVKTNGDFARVNLTVRPVVPGPGESPLADVFLIILEAAPSPDLPEPEPEPAGAPPAEATAGQVAALQQELRAKEEYLQATIEEMETSNEELKSMNEEMQSVNEELQSTNEELETSKEEMQSVNEELSTVNAELQSKVAELSRANDDLNNLLAGTRIGTLFVDKQLHITRFTPATTEVINLIETDIGRPVGHIASNLVGYDRLVDDIKQVLARLVPIETEVQTQTGAWYQMNIQPYRTLDDVIKGTVITFVEITDRKQMAAALREAALREKKLLEAQVELAGNIVDTVREPLLVLDNALKVVRANRTFYRIFQVTPDETVGCLLTELGNRQWDIQPLRQMLAEVLEEDTTFEDFEISHNFQQLGQRTMLLNARPLVGESDAPELILLAIEDITGRTAHAQGDDGG